MTTIQTSQSTDDAGYSVLAMGWAYDRGDIVLGEFFGSVNGKVGLLFRNVPITKGATIPSSTLELRAKGAASGGSILAEVFCEAIDTGVTFSTEANWDGRVRTANSVIWSFPDQVDGQWVESPDLSVVVKEVTDRAGWVAGNNIVFLIPGVAASTDDRIMRDFDYNGLTSAPRFHFTYTTPTVYDEKGKLVTAKAVVSGSDALTAKETGKLVTAKAVVTGSDTYIPGSAWSVLGSTENVVQSGVRGKSKFIL